MRVTCGWCGKEFDVRKAEYNRQHRRGKTKFFCCRSHAAIYGNSLRPPGTSPSALHKKAREAWLRMYGSEPLCEICGKPGDVHHEDKDPANNSRENLRALCRTHHVAHHNHQRDTGRGSRQ